MFLRLFFGKRIGTTFRRYGTVKKLKGLKLPNLDNRRDPLHVERPLYEL